MENTHTVDCSDSSAIQSASYDSASETLSVSFGAGSYSYTGVSLAEYEAFRDSDSKGQAIETIKENAVDCERV